MGAMENLQSLQVSRMLEAITGAVKSKEDCRLKGKKESSILLKAPELKTISGKLYPHVHIDLPSSAVILLQTESHTRCLCENTDVLSSSVTIMVPVLSRDVMVRQRVCWKLGVEFLVEIGKEEGGQEHGCSKQTRLQRLADRFLLPGCCKKTEYNIQR